MQHYRLKDIALGFSSFLFFSMYLSHANVVFGKKIFKNELFCILKFRRETLICHLFFSGEKIPKQTSTKYSSFRSIGSLPFWTDNRLLCMYVLTRMSLKTYMIYLKKSPYDTQVPKAYLEF